MKYFAIILLLMLSFNCFAISGDITGDGKVDVEDLIILADEWLSPGTLCDFDYSGRVDFKDFALFAENWQGQLLLHNTAPAANDITISATTYIPTEIILQGSDDGLPLVPGKVKNIITYISDYANLYVQDEVSGGQKKIRESDLPYKLSTWGKTLIVASDAAAAYSVKYKAFDGLLYSAEKTITINVAANPQDCLSLNGKGRITFLDNDIFELVNKRGYALFVQTRDPSADLICKYAEGQAGFRFVLIGGVPTVQLYSDAGLSATVKHVRKINDGRVHNIGFIYDANGFVTIHDCCDFGTIEFFTTGWVEVSSIDYTNEAEFLVGQNYKGEIDNIRVYLMDSLWDAYYNYDGYVWQSPLDAGNLNAILGITLSPGAIVRFHCDFDGINNTATQIYDDVSAAHLIGNFNSSDHVKYIPFFWHWSDSSFFHQVNR